MKKLIHTTCLFLVMAISVLANDEKVTSTPTPTPEGSFHLEHLRLSLLEPFTREVMHESKEKEHGEPVKSRPFDATFDYETSVKFDGIGVAKFHGYVDLVSRGDLVRKSEQVQTFSVKGFGAMAQEETTADGTFVHVGGFVNLTEMPRLIRLRGIVDNLELAAMGGVGKAPAAAKVTFRTKKFKGVSDEGYMQVGFGCFDIRNRLAYELPGTKGRVSLAYIEAHDRNPITRGENHHHLFGVTFELTPPKH